MTRQAKIDEEPTSIVIVSSASLPRVLEAVINQNTGGDSGARSDHRVQCGVKSSPPLLYLLTSQLLIALLL